MGPSGSALTALLKKAAKPPAKVEGDTDEGDRRQARLAAVREFRSAQTDEEAEGAFEALMESYR